MSVAELESVELSFEAQGGLWSDAFRRLRRNPGAIIGNITSPLFGQANQPAGSGNAIFSESANNRRLELQMRFAF